MDRLSPHGLRAPYQPSRRGFLIAMMGAGVMLGYARSGLAAVEFLALGTQEFLPLGTLGESSASELFEPTIWYGIDPSGALTVNIIRAEMGQHVGTALARVVADELEADWGKVRIVEVDSDPKWGEMLTGGSWSVWQSFPVLSRAVAAGRIALVEEGAKLLGVGPQSCTARNGAVEVKGRSILYGDIVARGDLRRTYTPEQLDEIPIEAPAKRRLIGRDTLALDVPSKTNGKARYGIDAVVEGMIYARPKVPPTRYDSKVVSIDDSAAKGLPGYIQSLALDDPSGTVPGWVMVYAQSFMAASRAADLVKVTWNSGEAANVSERDLQRRAAELIADPKGGALVVDDPGVDAALTSANKTLERTYTTSTVMHFALEPINALAFEKDGVFEIHTGNQWQSLILPVLAKALGRNQDKIVLRTYSLGGGFGRRLDGDYTVPAALAAKAIGKPVKMVCTRPDDMHFDCPRSPWTQVLRMAFGDGGRVTAMDHHAAAGWPTAVMAPSLMPKDAHGVPFDPFAIHGADHWYTVGAQRLRALRNDLADRSFRPGYLRSVGSGWVNWALESFMDEAVHAAGVDPVAFRLRLLDGAGRDAGSPPNAVGGARRQAAVLARVAQKAGWGSATPNDVGLGVATTFGQEREMPTWVACVARVRVDRTSGRVTVEKLTLVIDAGTIIHPDSAEAQVEGGALWGLSMALHEGSEFVKGQPKDTNLSSVMPRSSATRTLLRLLSTIMCLYVNLTTGVGFHSPSPHRYSAISVSGRPDQSRSRTLQFQARTVRDRNRSGLMRERLPHGFRTDRQVTNASARGGKDRIPDRGRDCGRRRLAEANRRFRAREKFDLEFGYVAHAQQRIGIFKIATIVAGQRPGDLTREETVAYDLASALVSGGILRALTYQQAVRLFGEEGTAEFIYLVGLYCMVSVTLNGFDVPVPEVDESRKPPAVNSL